MGMRNGSKTRRLTAAERRELALLESYYRTAPGAVEECEVKHFLLLRQFDGNGWTIEIVSYTTGETILHTETHYRLITCIAREFLPSLQ